MQIFHDIDGVHIPYDPEWKSVAISVSGGADSALLAYLICSLAKEHNTTIHIINHVRCWKTKPWQQHDADKVYNWLFQRFYNNTFKRHTGFIAPELEYGNIGPTLTDEYGKQVSGDNIQQRAYAEYICHIHGIDAYYNGVTRNPRTVAFDGMQERDIEPTEENKHLYLMKHMNGWAIHPFRFVEKNWIYKQYKNLKILDLWNLSRSCEGTFDNIDYRNYTPNTVVPECKECFWCKERQWAQDANN